MKFTDKVAIVTGGANGIGLEVVKGMVSGGAKKVIIADLNEEAGAAVIQELGDIIAFYKMDLGDNKDIRAKMAQMIADHGKIDVFVNSAGVVSTMPFEEVTDEEWEKVIRINLSGTFTTNSVIFDHFKDNGGGRIVNVSSVAGKLGGGLLGTAAYASSKAGVNGLTKAVAKEGGKYGIYCNAVCPSFTNTAMTAQLSEDPERAQKVINMIPLGKRAEPVEIAQMILFFASDLASFVTGEIGDVDGGITMDG